jgi:outer membrane protein
MSLARRTRRAAVLAAWMGLSVAPLHAAEPPLKPGESLTLSRAIAIALAQHPAALAEQSRVTAAHERVGEARSELLPQVNGVAEYLRATNNGIGNTAYLSAPGIPRFPTSGRHVNQLTDTFDNYLGGLTAYQYLLDFGRARGVVAERRAEADAERARLALVKLDLVFDVSRAYFDLLAAREIVHVFEQAVAQRTEHLHAAEAKARAGLQSDIDRYTAEAELGRAKLHLADAQAAAATAKLVLDEAMGLGEGAPAYRQADRLVGPTPHDEVGTYLHRALKDRPDLLMFQDEARAAGAIIDEYKSDYWPTVGAVAGADVRGQTATPGTNLHVGLVISWPIFNGFLTDHQVDEARARADAIQHDIEGLRQRVALDVQRAYVAWQSAAQRIEQARRTLDTSRAELDLAQRRYDTGLGSIIELTDAQRRYTDDGAELVRALAAASTAEAELARNTGDAAPVS